jgi:hypothetical protein
LWVKIEQNSSGVRVVTFLLQVSKQGYSQDRGTLKSRWDILSSAKEISSRIAEDKPWGAGPTALPFVAEHTKEFHGFFGFIVAIKKYRGISAVRIMAGCAGQFLAGF